MQQDEEHAGPMNPYAAPLSLSATPTSADDDVFAAEDFKPFKTIWTRPRATIRSIVAADPALHVNLLASLGGIGQVLDRASMRNAGDALPMWGILAVACVVGPLVGLVGLWISSHLIRFSGVWLGGAGLREQIKAAVAWSSVPTVFALALWIPQILLLGSEMFTTETPRLEAQPWLWFLIVAIALTELVLGVWSFVLLCKTVAEVQGYRSAWRGLGNLVLAGMLLFVPLFVILFGILLLLAVALKAQG